MVLILANKYDLVILVVDDNVWKYWALYSKTNTFLLRNLFFGFKVNQKQKRN